MSHLVHHLSHVLAILFLTESVDFKPSDVAYVYRRTLRFSI